MAADFNNKSTTLHHNVSSSASRKNLSLFHTPFVSLRDKTFRRFLPASSLNAASEYRNLYLSRGRLVSLSLRSEELCNSAVQNRPMFLAAVTRDLSVDTE
jgi:hypothetical protein